MPPKADSCNRCGAELPVNIPEGLCPRCLMAGGLDLLEGPPTLTTNDAPEASLPVTPFTGTRLRYFGDYELIEVIRRTSKGGCATSRSWRNPRTTRMESAARSRRHNANPSVDDPAGFNGRKASSAGQRGINAVIGATDSWAEIGACHEAGCVITAQAFSPDKRWLATACENGRVRLFKLWNVATRREMMTLPGHTTDGSGGFYRNAHARTAIEHKTTKPIRRFSSRLEASSCAREHSQ